MFIDDHRGRGRRGGMTRHHAVRKGASNINESRLWSVECRNYVNLHTRGAEESALSWSMGRAKENLLYSED